MVAVSHEALQQLAYPDSRLSPRLIQTFVCHSVEAPTEYPGVHYLPCGLVFRWEICISSVFRISRSRARTPDFFFFTLCFSRVVFSSLFIVRVISISFVICVLYFHFSFFPSTFFTLLVEQASSAREQALRQHFFSVFFL